MKAIITGAAGFVGRQLVSQLLQQGHTELHLLDARIPEGFFADYPGVTCLEGELQNPDIRAQILEREFDTIFHLAAVPGGAAEVDPQLSRQVNLDATLALGEEAATATDCPRIVYTSTIAVLPSPMPALVDDSCPIEPVMTYGTHKAMIELALADMSRRGLLDSVGVRLPGILARPPASSGLKSAFMSNVFHALKAGEDFVSPVSPQATMWLMSVRQCAANLIYAADMDSAKLPVKRCVTLPVVRASMGDLVQAVAEQLGVSADLVTYDPDPALEAVFGSQPPVITAAAEAAGFRNDGSLEQLVQRALADCG